MKENLLKDLKILIVEDEKRLAQLLKDAINDYFFFCNYCKRWERGFKKV